jgi:hypothetical protein
MNNDLIFYRNAMSTFRAGFYSDVAQTIPIVPINSDYPKYSIYDPSGVEILAGTGSPGVGAGVWQAQLMLDENLALTTPEDRYKITWVMVNINNQQFNFSQEFELFDTVVSEPENREQKYITLAGQAVRLKLTLDHEPDDLGVAVFQGNDENNVLFSAPKTALTKVRNGNEYTFFVDLPAAITMINQKYSIIWKVRRTVTDTEQFTFQSMSAIGPATLSLITSVRMLIDKFQKGVGTIQAYEDSDIVEYLERGAELVNAQYPITYFSFGTMPSALNVYHIMLSSWYALNAQQILEIDLGFDFSGQSVTLNYDHASALADVLGRWQEFIKDNLSAAKMSILNATSGVGTSAGRGYRFTQNMTYRVASLGTSGQVTANSVLGQMNTLGLLW